MDSKAEHGLKLFFHQICNFPPTGTWFPTGWLSFFPIKRMMAKLYYSEVAAVKGYVSRYTIVNFFKDE